MMIEPGRTKGSGVAGRRFGSTKRRRDFVGGAKSPLTEPAGFDSVTQVVGRFLSWGKSTMGEPKRVVAPRVDQRYRELASKLRGIARQSRLPGARQKILDLALRFEGRADHADRRGPTKDFPTTPAN
jgi:hypothetical protein